jgi:hypothetical protein
MFIDIGKELIAVFPKRAEQQPGIGYFAWGCFTIFCPDPAAYAEGCCAGPVNAAL